MGTPYTDGFGILQGADALLLTPTNGSLNSFSPLVTFPLERGIQALNVRFMYSSATILFNETIRATVQFWYDGPLITSAATQSTAGPVMTYYFPADHQIWSRTETFNWAGESPMQLEFDTSMSPVNRLTFSTVSFGFQTKAPQNVGIQIYCDHSGLLTLNQHTRFQGVVQVSTVKAS